MVQRSRVSLFSYKVSFLVYNRQWIISLWAQSAKTGEGVEEAFDELARQALYSCAESMKNDEWLQHAVCYGPPPVLSKGICCWVIKILTFLWRVILFIALSFLTRLTNNTEEEEGWREKPTQAHAISLTFPTKCWFTSSHSPPRLPFFLVNEFVTPSMIQHPPNTSGRFAPLSSHL